MRSVAKQVIRSASAVVFALGAASVSAQQKLTPVTAQFENPEFGAAIAVGDGDLFVGAPRGATPAQDRFNVGYVAAYRRDAAGWQSNGRVDPADLDVTFFGHAVATGGGWLAIASRKGPYSSNPLDLDAVIDLYRRNGTAWEFAERRTLPRSRHWGMIDRLVVSDTTLAASISTWNGDVRQSMGVYVYDRVGGAWGATPAALPAPHLQRYFGAALSLDGDTLLVGDPITAPGPNTSGAVSTFVRVNGVLTAMSVVTPASLPALYRYGQNVAQCGPNRIAATILPTQTLGTNGGQVLVYTGTPQQWTLDGAALVSPRTNGVGNDSFGASIACSGDTLVIGEPEQRSAFIVDLDGSRVPRQLRVDDGSSNYAGAPVLVSGDDVLMADPRQGGGAGVGAVYAYNDAVRPIFADAFE